MNVEECTRIIQYRFPHLPVSSVSPALEGIDYAVFEVNGRWIFRFAERPDVRRKLHKEIRLLPEVAKSLSISIPRFEFIHESHDDNGVDFVGYARIEGIPLTAVCMKGERSVQLTEQLAGLLREIHAFPQQIATTLGVPHFTPYSWRADYQAFFLNMQNEVFRLLGRDLCLEVSRLWEAFLCDDSNFCFVSVLIHRDLCPAHILVNEEGTTITGIIDWGDATIGDPAFEFARLLTAYGGAATQSILERYRPIDKSFRHRIGFYAKILPFNKIAFGLLQGKKRLVDMGIRHLEMQLRTPDKTAAKP